MVTTSFEYDELDRLRFTRAPGINENGAAVTIVTENTYDSMGNVLAYKDERGNTTTNTYSPRGFLLHIKDPLEGISYFEYDFAGRLTAKVSPRHYTLGANIANLPRKTYTYDKMDRVLTKTDIYRTYGTGIFRTVVSESLEYDKNGNVINKTDAHKNVLRVTVGFGTNVHKNLLCDYGLCYRCPQKLVE
jgi:YD repeat-containing protein